MYLYIYIYISFLRVRFLYIKIIIFKINLMLTILIEYASICLNEQHSECELGLNMPKF